MSQAVIDFCEGLKTTLLGIEEKLTQAKSSLDAGAEKASGEARKQIDEATEKLQAFRTQAAQIAEQLRAEMPGKTEEVKAKLKDFSGEAQVAMRHAVVFLAEAASKGAQGAAVALQEGSKSASALAEKLKRETAVATTEPPADTPA